MEGRVKDLHAIEANPANAVLVVVDVQNAFAKAGGLNAARGAVTEAQEQAALRPIAAIQKLVGQARATSVPIVYIQSVRTHNEPLITIFNFPRILAIGSWDAAIVDELTPREDEIVVQKFSLDPFFRTKLDKVLEGMVPEPTQHQAIVTGGAANVCAYNAVMGFHLRDYWTVVATDALYGSEPGREYALAHFSSPVYPNIVLTRSDLIRFSATPTRGVHNLVPNS
jgi:ureidoacrylate peracid hydrolase